MPVPPCACYDESGTSHGSPVERGGTYFTKEFLMSAGILSYPESNGHGGILPYIGGVVFSTFHLLFGKVNLIKYFK